MSRSAQANVKYLLAQGIPSSERPNSAAYPFVILKLYETNGKTGRFNYQGRQPGTTIQHSKNYSLSMSRSICSYPAPNSNYR